MKKGTLIEFLRLYAIYIFALMLAATVTFINFMFLMTSSLVIVLLYIARLLPSDIGSSFLALAAFSAPAAFIFHIFLKNMAFAIRKCTTFISYAAGNLIATVLLRLVDRAALSVPDGLLIFSGLACTAGFAFLYWQRIPDQIEIFKAET